MGERARIDLSGLSIWGFAFGYFAAYVPYSAVTKAVTAGWIEGEPPLSGFAVTPLSVLASVVGMYIFITAMGWWKHAHRAEVAGKSLPSPTRYTFVSGLLTAAIVITTTLAYTFEGVSIVFMMLLMRGGVLIIAPIVDTLTGRRTRWYSWMGLALSMAALLVAFSESTGFALRLVAVIDVAIYLASYFFRLRFMSRFAKSDAEDASKQYFVEEQMVATPSLLLFLTVVALIGPPLFGTEGTMGEIVGGIRAGFVDVWSTGVWGWVIFIGICSQFTGIFGGLVLLDKRENTYCVPVNRCSSILAGVIASYSLYWVYGKGAPSAHKLAGAGLIVTAILFLTLPPMLEKLRAQRAAAAGAGAAPTTS